MKTYGTARLRDGVWELELTPDTARRFKRVFGQTNKRRRGPIVLTSTPAVCKDIDWFMDRYPLKVDDLSLAELRQRVRTYDARQREVLRVLNGKPRDYGDVKPAREPKGFQRTAVDLVLATKALLLGDDAGLGKTMSCLLTLMEEELLPAVAVVPTHLQRQWADELRKTLPWLKSHIVRTMKPYEMSKHLEMNGEEPDLVILPYSKLAGWADHLAGNVNAVFFDEMQELRHDGTQKYGAACQIADGCALRMGATATPVYNYGGEIFNLIVILDEEVLGTRSEFGTEWCGGQTGPKARVEDPEALGMFLRDRGIFLRRTRRDVGEELPRVQRIVHSVDLDEDVLYDSLEADGAFDLAQLIVSGHGDRAEIFTARGDFDLQMRKATGLSKAPYVAEFTKLVLESEPKVVLWGWHRSVYDVWLDKLAHYGPVMYTGSESVSRKRLNVERFLTEEDARVLIMSLRSGEGLDGLQEVCSVGIFGELDWSPARHDQCVWRLDRTGQLTPVVAYFLVSDFGSDPIVSQVNTAKRQQQEPIRNPGGAAFEQIEDKGERIKQMAEEALRQRARRRR